MKAWLPRRTGRLLALSMFALLAACGKEPAVPDPPRPVLTHVVSAITPATNCSAISGEVRSRYETPLAFRIAGKITARLVDRAPWSRPVRSSPGSIPATATLSAAAAAAQLELASRRPAALPASAGEELRQPGRSRYPRDGLQGAQAQAALARNQSSYTVLQGRAGRGRGTHRGEVGQVVAAGQTVMRLARADTLEVAIAIPESRMTEYARSAAPR
jgi:multidrug efflux system membrane fusion protein